MTADCCVCGAWGASLVRQARNALPAGVWICAPCKASIARREVGIVRRADGTLHVTDGRPVAVKAGSA